MLTNINLPARTQDNFRVRLMANIESADEIKVLKKYGAEGVGLYRTEFIYLSKRINAVEGRLAFCPGTFEYTHRGNPPLSNEKYTNFVTPKNIA